MFNQDRRQKARNIDKNKIQLNDHENYQNNENDQTPTQQI